MAAWSRQVSASPEHANRVQLATIGAARCVRNCPPVPANKLDAMEQLHPEDNSPAIEVLDGQTTVEELLADLGFEWRPQYVGDLGQPADGQFSQPALF